MLRPDGHADPKIYLVAPIYLAAPNDLAARRPGPGSAGQGAWRTGSMIYENGTAFAAEIGNLTLPGQDFMADGENAPGDEVRLGATLESLLFVADCPVALIDLARAAQVSRGTIERALGDLSESLSERGVRLQRNNGHVQMVSAPESAEAIQRFLGLEASTRLSKAALETLAIVAYEQPVTRPEIDQLRGVNSDGVLRTLIGRGLAEEVGRRETVGLPVEYGTTFMFLEYFGLDGLGDLPAVEDFADVATAVEDAHAALWGDDDAEDGSEVPEPEGAGAAITETAITETAIAGPVIAETAIAGPAIAGPAVAETAIAETEGAETEGEERFAAR